MLSVPDHQGSDKPRRHRWLRVLLTAFLALTCLKAWTGTGEFNPIASAQIPDSGLQRKQLLGEVRITNQLLAQILNALKTRTIKVQIQGTDNNIDERLRGQQP